MIGKLQARSYNNHQKEKRHRYEFKDYEEQSEITPRYKNSESLDKI